MKSFVREASGSRPNKSNADVQGRRPHIRCANALDVGYVRRLGAMRKTFAALAFAISANAAVATDTIPLVQPKEARVSLVEAGNGSARFSGQLVVSGTLVAKWWPPHERLPDDQPDYEIVPDAKFKKLLPHYSGYTVRKIELLNGPEALKLAAGEVLAQRLATRKIPMVKAKGTFVLDSYEVGIECDAPWSKARFVKVQRQGEVRVFKSQIQDGC